MSSAKVQYGDANAREMFRPGTKMRDTLGKTLGWMAKLAERLGEDTSTLTFRVSSSISALKNKQSLIEKEDENE